MPSGFAGVFRRLAELVGAAGPGHRQRNGLWEIVAVGVPVFANLRDVTWRAKSC